MSVPVAPKESMRKGRAAKKAGATGKHAKKATLAAKPADRETIDVDAVTDDVMRRISKTREILAR